MSGKNSEVDGAIFAIAVVLTIAYIIFAVVAVIVGMISFVLTILAVIAWIDDGLTLGGEHISRAEAQEFIVRGLIFAVGFPIFWALLMGLLGEPNHVKIEWLVIAGYVFGSAGIEVLEAWDESQKQEASQQVILPPLPEPDSYLPPVSPPVRPREPFGYASWDDEELRP